MIEEPSSTQQQTPTQIIQVVLGGLKLEVTELTMVPVDTEEAIIVEAIDELSLDRGIEVQAQVKVESGPDCNLKPRWAVGSRRISRL